MSNMSELELQPTYSNSPVGYVLFGQANLHKQPQASAEFVMYLNSAMKHYRLDREGGFVQNKRKPSAKQRKRLKLRRLKAIEEQAQVRDNLANSSMGRNRAQVDRSEERMVPEAAASGHDYSNSEPEAQVQVLPENFIFFKICRQSLSIFPAHLSLCN